MKFDAVNWIKRMQRAILAQDAEALASLMYENDRNGCFSYEAFQVEFGETDRDEWAESTVECAVNMLETLRDDDPELWAAATR